MKEKLRILWCGEASTLNTGYAIYAKEVLTGLYNTNKYTIAELGCYSAIDNPKRFEQYVKFFEEGCMYLQDESEELPEVDEIGR